MLPHFAHTARAITGYSANKAHRAVDCGALPWHRDRGPEMERA